MTEFCEVCLTEGVDFFGDNYSDPDKTSWICNWCVKDVIALMNLVRDVPMMVTDEEFVKMFRTKFEQEHNK